MNQSLIIYSDSKQEKRVISAGYCRFEGREEDEYSSTSINDFRMIYLERGSIRFQKDGNTVGTAEAGDMILLTPNSRSETLCTANCRDVWISFSGFEDVLCELSLSTEGITVSRVKKYRELIYSYSNEIISELQMKETGYHVAAIAKLYEIMIIFSRELGSKEQSDSTGIKKLSPALRLMITDYTNTLTMDSYARECNMSKSSFLHTFSKVMGTTPIKYINSIKLKNSEPMLCETDMPISEIAQALGFSSSQYYSNTFKKYYGIKPTEYRNKSKNS
jgi:AraC-like DNA-binding protein